MRVEIFRNRGDDGAFPDGKQIESVSDRCSNHGGAHEKQAELSKADFSFCGIHGARISCRETLPQISGRGNVSVKGRATAPFSLPRASSGKSAPPPNLRGGLVLAQRSGSLDLPTDALIRGRAAAGPGKTFLLRLRRKKRFGRQPRWFRRSMLRGVRDTKKLRHFSAGTAAGQRGSDCASLV